MLISKKSKLYIERGAEASICLLVDYLTRGVESKTLAGVYYLELLVRKLPFSSR